ncbi:hypothetical protein BRADI_5g02010v3 [Brachypodium distachyon]|uniref:ABC transporter domain-containing protein n=1 Tax=Brachypodium distachyon TaxID=15368 RepID=A0A2K2CEZ7_BRADI|nr:hypothetical protein BRADI_5g02010v3 [Brachypodium distachyon]
MAASSPLPRWAPTPSPSGPLWSTSASSSTAAATADPWCGLTACLSSSVFFAPLPVGPPKNDAVAGNFDGVETTAGARRDDETKSSCPETTMFLTWEDLSVTAVSGGSSSEVSLILDGLSGQARPGELLALMGPSGSGKTTLLDALAGRLGPNMKRRGDILINGVRDNKLAFRTSAYVTQENTLMATLTVAEAVHYSAQLQLPDSMSPAEKRSRADNAIQNMGLAGVSGTRISGRACKGISGGQRKRVSICMELLSSPALIFLDEPTSGLDSAASYHVMSRIAGIAGREGMTVIAAVHQPSTEVFELFHGLCLLAKGRTVYFGPASKAIEFFDDNGFPCPMRMNPSDHFLRMINTDFEESEEGSTINLPRAAEVIQTLVNSSSSLGTLRTKTEATKTIIQSASVKKKKQASFLTKSVILTKRSFINMHRDLGYYWLRFAIYIALCLSIGTIYFNIGHTYASIQIFEKERLSGHYRATEFVIANTVSSIPYLGFISILPAAIAYYLTGLQRGIDHFVYFAATIWASMMLVEGLMMIVAAIVPDFLLGIITGSGVQGLLMLNAGFFRLPADLPKPVWKYPTYFISYHKYASQGLYKNEFIGLVFQDLAGARRINITGQYILKNNLQVELGYSKWVDLAILFAMIVIYRVLFLVIIKVSEIAKPMKRCLIVKV